MTPKEAITSIKMGMRQNFNAEQKQEIIESFVIIDDLVAKAEMKSRHIYPLCVLKDRYNGVYSGGVFLAINENAFPEDVYADDVSCAYFWFENEEHTIGIGDTIDEAIADLIKRLGK